MRNDMYTKLQQYSHHEYEKIGVPSLVTRMTSDAFVLMQFTEQVLRMGQNHIECGKDAAVGDFFRVHGIKIGRTAPILSVVLF